MEKFIYNFYYFLGCINGHVIGISKFIGMKFKMMYMGIKINIWKRKFSKFNKELEEYVLYLEETIKRLESEQNA